MRNYTSLIGKLHGGRWIASAMMLSVFTTVLGGQPWKLSLTSPEEKINLHLDLYEESIEVPGLEAFGPMNGYLDGNIYGVWYVVGFDIKDYPNAFHFFENEITLPLYTKLTDEQVDYILENFKDIIH